MESAATEQRTHGITETVVAQTFVVVPTRHLLQKSGGSPEPSETVSVRGRDVQHNSFIFRKVITRVQRNTHQYSPYTSTEQSCTKHSAQNLNDFSSVSLWLLACRSFSSSGSSPAAKAHCCITVSGLHLSVSGLRSRFGRESSPQVLYSVHIGGIVVEDFRLA